MKTGASILLAAAATTAALLFSGCGRFDIRLGGERATPSPVTVVEPSPATASSPTPQPTATSTPWRSPALTPEATPPRLVSRQEGEALVRRFFAALESEDEVALEEVVAGEAKETARGIVDQVRRQEAANRVEINARTRSLEFLGEEQRGTGIALTTRYSLDISARAGFFTAPVQINEGQAVFTADWVDGEPRLTRIEGIGP